MNPTQMFTPWKPLAVLLLVALSFWGVSTWRYASGWYAGALNEKKGWEQRWSERDAADAKERAARERAERDLENHRREEMDRLAHEAKEKLNAANSDAARAATIAGGLQQRITELKRQLAKREACGVSSTASGGQAATATTNLLADLLSESIRRNEALADYADRARIAGLTCEQAYLSTQETGH